MSAKIIHLNRLHHHQERTAGPDSLHSSAYPPAGEDGSPRRLQLGPNRVGWRVADIEAWLKERMPAGATALSATSPRAPAGLPYRLLLTKTFPLRTRVADFLYAELARQGLPLFRTALVERAAYREMFLNGQPPTVTEPGKGAGSKCGTCSLKSPRLSMAERRNQEGGLT